MASTNDTYLTLGRESQAVIREKASKFLAFAFPVDCEIGVTEHLDALRRSYHNATHHCFAYRIGHPSDPLYRLTDDGEPSGTAGKPIYGQLVSRQLSDALVVVVRYFGGTKLGVAGLIKAYRSAAAAALEQNSFTEKVLYHPFSVSFPVQSMNDVMRILKSEEAAIHSQDFDDRYTIRFSVRRSRVNQVSQKLSSLLNIYIYE